MVRWSSRVRLSLLDHVPPELNSRRELRTTNGVPIPAKRSVRMARQKEGQVLVTVHVRIAYGLP
jgi:hypothetical protein